MKEEQKALQTNESYSSPEIEILDIKFEQSILGGSGELGDLPGDVLVKQK